MPTTRPSSAFLLALLAIAGAAHAQGPNVAIVAAAGGSLQFNDVEAKLNGTGVFSTVTVINAGALTPTLAELQQFDAVMTWSNTNYSDPVALGNVLADYVDAGGGVVVTVFANTSPTSARYLQGRWRQEAYEIIPAGLNTVSGGGAQQLGTVHDPAHPIMQQVNSFDGGTQSFRPATLDLHPHGVRIADWTDGRTLVAVSSQFARRADLGFYPPSSDASSSWWLSSTDGARLLANSLLYTIAGGDPPCYANCDASTVEPVLNVDDFTCFINEFAAAQSLPHEQQVSHYANCDGSTTAPVLNVDDFTCFINEFAQGCP